MLAFTDTRYTKEHYAKKLIAFVDNNVLSRENSTVRYMLGEYDTDLFGVGFGVPYWFEEVINLIHTNCVDTFWNTFTTRWMSAIGEGVDIEPLRLLLLIHIQKENINRLSLDSNNVYIIKKMYKVVEVLQMAVDAENGGRRLDVLVNQNMQLTRLMVSPLVNNCTPSSRPYVLSALEVFKNETHSVARAIRFAHTHSSPAINNIMGNKIIELLGDLKK